MRLLMVTPRYFPLMGGVETHVHEVARRLARRGVEAMFGTLGNPAHSWDGRFARERRDQYAAFADTGLTVIATDRPIEAARDLDANDGAEGIGALQCVSGR